MSTGSPRRLSASESLAAMKGGELTSADLVNDVLEACAAQNEALGAYLAIDQEGARRQAADCDDRHHSGQARLLEGVPVALKDILITPDLPTTAGSRILDGFRAPYEGTVVRRLRDAGAVVIGKTNMDEFAMGSSNENSAYCLARNPWDVHRAPGGSSGGSAVAVAADLCGAALGTDTGGSIRQPASFCGIVGLKPTYGRVSRFGVIAFASSLDQVGPMTKTVEDAALMLEVIGGHDPADSTSADQPLPSMRAGLAQGVEGLRVGVPREYFVEGLDPEVDASVRAAIATLEAQGATLVDISLPHTEYAVATYYLIATAEASSNLARYDGVRYGRRDADSGDLHDVYFRSRWNGFGDEVKRRIMLGTFVLSAGYYDAYYLKAQKVRTLIRRDFEQAFAQVDVIATPTAPSPAFALGERTDDPLEMYLSDIYTISCNLAGLPGLSMPCGLSRAGLPIGLQLLGKPWDEATLLQVAAAYERARGAFARPGGLP